MCTASCTSRESAESLVPLFLDGIFTETDFAVPTLSPKKQPPQNTRTTQWRTMVFIAPNARPERRGAEGVRMQTGRAIPRPLQAACSALSYNVYTPTLK